MKLLTAMCGLALAAPALVVGGAADAAADPAWSQSEGRLSELESSFLLSHGAPMAEKLSFLGWAREHGKAYEDVSAVSRRFGVWAASAALVEAHNKREDVSYTLGLNAFADMTDLEFRDAVLMDLGAEQDCSATTGNHAMTSEEMPTHMDWRDRGVVSPVKSQGHCGSCWTFSSTGALEAHHAIATGRKVLLSEQQLVDCAQAFNNHGCSGGLPSQAFEYVMYNGGLDTERSYPYVGKDDKCNFHSTTVGVKVSGVHNITRGSEEEILDALAHVGPVSVAFEVAGDFRLYAGGVYDSSVCHSDAQHVNHAVLAVGYDPESFLIKNSWGAKWGIGGYFKMVRGKNMCGIATCASYPKVEKDMEQA